MDGSTPSKAQLLGMKKGLYSQDPRMQNGVAAMCESILTRTGQHVPLPNTSRPLVMAEWGCAHGANSFAPVVTIATALEERLSKEAVERQIEVVVVHEDVPANDWTALFIST